MPEREHWMRHALDLAARGRGAAEPNPMVGAVLVRDGVLVGEGFTSPFGGPHAEVNALADAGDAARGAVLYVTLEPCCHHGKTPPCTDAVIRAGVARVEAALVDPNPLVAGKGLGQLRAAGVETAVGLLADEAARVNAPFVKLVSRRRPWVVAKWAMTLDGKLASSSGDSNWISCEASRAEVHDLRGRVDAILIGRGTAEADDPSLTARPPGPRTAARVVVDSHARLASESQLASTARNVPVLVAVTGAAPHGDVARLRAAGCECLTLPESNGRVDLSSLLDELGARQMTNVLVEGGGEIHGALFDGQLVDQVVCYLATGKVLGGAAAKSPVAGAGAACMAEALQLANVRVRTVGDDVCVTGLTPQGRAVVDEAVETTLEAQQGDAP